MVLYLERVDVYLVMSPHEYCHTIIVITNRSMAEGLLIEAQMTQRQLNYQSPLQHGDNSQSWKPGAHCSLQAGQQVGERPFQVPHLV